MKLNKCGFYENFLLLLIIAFFLLILPGIAAVGGSLLLVYIDGIASLPPVTSRLGFAAIFMLVVSLIAGKILKVNQSFIKTPSLLILVGLVLIPLQAELKNVFSVSTASAATTDLIAQTLLVIAPVTLLVVALFLMGGELANLTWKKLKGRC